MAKKYAFFLGCIMPNRYPGVEASTRYLMTRYGIELLDMKGASCCPAPGVFGSFDLYTWIVIAARNLCIAESLGADIVTCCNGCYGSLQEANHLLKENKELREWVNEILKNIDKEFKGTIEVKHVIEVIEHDIGLNRIRSEVERDLSGLKVAAHYGCHFLKPREVRRHEHPERPTILDRIIETTNAISIDYRDKLMCCGAGGGVRAGSIDVSLDMTREKVQNMMRAGADCLTTPCVFCHLQFDRGQKEIEDRMGVKLGLPVVFITQLIMLALGASPHVLGLQYNIIPVRPLLRKIGL